MAVHTMGKPCEMDTIMDIAKKHNLYVIEDSCEAHGAEYKGKMVGHWGDIATFSSHVSHLICSMEGGMISTNNQNIARLAYSLRNHGRGVEFDEEGRRKDSMYFNHERLGGNYKMNDLEAALGRAAISKFWETFNVRRDNLFYLLDKTKDLEDVAYMNVEKTYEKLCPHAFSLTLKDTEHYSPGDLDRYLNDNPIINIRSKRNFGAMPTQHDAFNFLGYKIGEFPESEYVGINGVHFGIHQYVNKADLDKMSDVLHRFFEEYRG